VTDYNSDERWVIVTEVRISGTGWLRVAGIVEMTLDDALSTVRDISDDDVRGVGAKNLETLEFVPV